MKKSTLLTLATLFTTIAMPSICTEQPLTTTAKPTYTFILPPIQNKHGYQPIAEIIEPYNATICKIFNIPYSKDKALSVNLDKVQFYTNSDSTKKIVTTGALSINDFTDNEKDLAEASKNFDQEFNKTAKPFMFPSRLSKELITEIETKKSITRDLGKCIVVFQLDTTQPTEEPQTHSSFKTYVTAYGPKVAIAGIFAYLMYLYMNNKNDQFMLITDFICNLSKLTK